MNPALVLHRVDAWLAASRPAWAWIGQLALVVLGVHLAADRLDDWLFRGLAALGRPSERGAAWAAVLVELAVAGRAGWILLSSVGGPEPTPRDWWARRSVEAFVRPIFWGAMVLAGAWVVGMAAEDLLAPVSPLLGRLAGWTVAALVAWRLGWTSWRRTTGGLFVPRRRTWGLAWAPPLVLVTALALASLPIWGWL